MEMFGIYQNDEDFILRSQVFLNKIKDKQVVVWGTGKLLNTFLLYKGKDLDIKYFVDTNTALQGKKTGEYDIRSPECIKNEDLEKTIVMILIIGYEKYLVEKELSSWGLTDDSYCFATDFILLNTYFTSSKLIVPMIYFFINSFCNLKCKHCIARIHNFVQNQNKFIPFEAIKNDIDVFFEYIDYVGLLSFASGEVILHPEFKKIIQYIYEMYRHKYNLLHFPTNGTILPDENLLDVLNKYNCHIAIDDYTHVIKERSKIPELIQLLKKHNVSHSVIDSFQSGKYENPTWDDVGDITISRNRSCKQNKSVYHKCALSLSCYNMYNAKLYFCGTACWYGVGGLYVPDNSDYVELPPPPPAHKEEYSIAAAA